MTLPKHLAGTRCAWAEPCGAAIFRILLMESRARWFMAMFERRRGEPTRDKNTHLGIIRVSERHLKHSRWTQSPNRASSVWRQDEGQNIMASMVAALTTQPFKYLHGDFGCVGALLGRQCGHKSGREGSEFKECTPKDQRGQCFGFRVFCEVDKWSPTLHNNVFMRL